MTDRAPAFVIVGRVRKAHGVRGELVVEPISDEPDAIFVSGRRFFVGDAEGRPDTRGTSVEVVGARPFKDGFLVTFTGITDRNAADLWRDRYLLIPESELPAPADDEIYLHDVPGMQVELPDGTVVGRVITVWELPQGLMLDVARGDVAPSAKESTVMIPYDERTVHSIDRDGRRIVVDVPDGLLD
ncbi:MAG: ribosome maturation factor RimM [Gemmatimonadaceae bacterium]